MMDLTFLIPVKLDSSDRVRNITTVISYLLTNYDAKILVKEFDTKTKFKTLIIPQLEEKFSPEQLKNLEFGMSIQDAMPNLNPNEREFILTGVVQEEWEELFAGFDEDM